MSIWAASSRFSHWLAQGISLLNVHWASLQKHLRSVINGGRKHNLMNHSSEVLSFHTMPIYTSIYRMTSLPIPILGWLTHYAQGRCLLFRQWPIKLGRDVTSTSVIYFTQLYTSINQLPKPKPWLPLWSMDRNRHFLKVIFPNNLQTHALEWAALPSGAAACFSTAS